MTISAKQKREIRKVEEERAKETRKARERADRKYNRPTSSPTSSSHVRPAGAMRVTNIYQPNYGDTINFTGPGNQVSFGNQGSLTQKIDEQNISTSPIDRDTTRVAVRDLLHHLQHGGIQIDDEDVAEQLRDEATDLQAVADTEEPDQGKMRQLASSIGAKLATISITAIGGFTAQLLAAAFLPPA